MDARFVYLPRPARGLYGAKSTFSASYGRTLKDLDRELQHLDARDVTIQAGFQQVRLDGWPYSSARPDHPAVIVQFRRGTRPEVLTFRGFRFATFEDNLRAIALSMEALRRVDRYGVVEGEQYQGFKQLEAPAAETSREDKLRKLAAQGATEGERAAADAALERMRDRARGG